MIQCWSKVSTDEYSCRTAHELIIFTISFSYEKDKNCHSVPISDEDPWVTQKNSHDIFT